MVGKILIESLKNYLKKEFEVLIDRTDKLMVREVGNPTFYQWNKMEGSAFRHLEGSQAKTTDNCYDLNSFANFILEDYL